jgi:hypothetical protein
VPLSRQNHMKKDVKVRPNRPIFVNELSDADMNRRYDTCHPLWYIYPKCKMWLNDPCSDECAIYRSQHDRNAVFRSKKTPRF